MTRGISEATDEHGVTHHVRGAVRFVKIAKRKRRRNPAKRGHYVTLEGSSWWCTGSYIPANTPAAPGKEVDCMACLVRPPSAPLPPFRTSTGRMLSRASGTTLISTPRSTGKSTAIFDDKRRKVWIRGRRR